MIDLSWEAAKLIALQADIQPGEFTLTTDVCTIGRSPACHITIARPVVSRLHARIERDEAGRYILYDIQSANGAFVNDQAQPLREPYRLRHKTHLAAVRHTYGNFRLTIHQQIAEGELVVTQITATGTHQNEWLGLQASGKQISLTGINIDRVVGGKIVEHWGEANTLGALFQMGGRLCRVRTKRSTPPSTSSSRNPINLGQDIHLSFLYYVCTFLETWFLI